MNKSTRKKTAVVKPKINRSTYNIDASGRILGRLACEIVTLLRGKNKPNFQYYLEQGNVVNIINASKLAVSGKKYAQKEYYHYSGYPGGLKTQKFSLAFSKNPAKVLKAAVWNMLPKNKLRAVMIRRLKISN